MARQLVTLREITSVEPIEGRDRIELAKVDGWQVIVKKDDFKPGMVGVYFEIDSLLPLDLPQFEFLKKGTLKTHHRLKTMKMGGVLSQGLLLRLTDFSDDFQEAVLLENAGTDDEAGFGLAEVKQEGGALAAPDYGVLAKLLGITKYEPVQPGEPGSPRVITFPAFLPRTDLERCQNLKREIQAALDSNEQFEVTEKLDGSSLTAYAWPLDPKAEQVKIGVCSRNQEIEYNAEAPGRYWRAALDASWPRALAYLAEFIGGAVAFQGELMGPSIQGNRKKLEKAQVFLFDIYSVSLARYLRPAERDLMLRVLDFKFGLTINHVPLLSLPSPAAPIEIMLSDVDEESAKSELPLEGIVLKSLTSNLRFKVISNSYLLKHDD